MIFMENKWDEIGREAEGKLFDYHVEKTKQPFDWHWQEANRISGSADYQPQDEGMHWSDIKN